ncbi:hypothetical protein DSO13_19525 [Salmonella enterica]|uniref:Uncharacterized protein n=1 Tax=Salmonella enterica TaxID=28901 RepID=A0A5T6GRF4_SALER|nr:hypothetical protein [Salmonella enterica subsp. enterica serovar Cotham]EBI4300944.1 hypothetical protein [Salmonella enterica]EBI7275531.1 hypothetical protein [Salmonella enterica]EBI8258514.1 hypothetical protein [Salmonella enterica]EBJ0958800.1 hypothetical protein [Salmonella enterica]
MGKIAGKIFLTSKKHHSNQSPAASSRCLQGTPLIPRTFSSCCITFRAVSPFMLLLLPLCNITGHAIRSAKSRHRPVMTDDMLMWSRSGTATPR